LLGAVSVLAVAAGSVVGASIPGSQEPTDPPSAIEGTPAFVRMTEAARSYFRQNLKKNREAARVFNQMLPVIDQFAEQANVSMIVCKCMDGRAHTNNHKGLPPTFATNMRSQGNVIDTGRGNRDLWNLFEYQAALANSEGKFLVILTSAHRSDLSGGCAAFKRPYDASPKSGDERAEFNVHEQALQLSTAIHEDDSIDSSRVRVLSAMTNTDTGAMRFCDQSGEPIFDSESVMKSEVLRDSSDVFEGAFLYRAISENWAHESIRGRPPQSLLDGPGAPFFSDMRIKIALEAYLIRRIKEGGSNPGVDVVRHDILKRMHDRFGKMPQPIHHFLTYMMAANLAHAAHYRNENTRLAKEDPEKLRIRMDHSELKMAYSLTGHDLEEPNTMILVKPGAGGDEVSVQIGKSVLARNLNALLLRDKLPPLVHINIEVDEPIDTWEHYLEVRSRMRAKLGIVKQVFGNDVRVLTTYSYRQNVRAVQTKQFFPLSANPRNARIVILPNEDLGNGIESRATFDDSALRQREKAYTETGLAFPETKTEKAEAKNPEKKVGSPL
jgi:hypothetical protein